MNGWVRLHRSLADHPLWTRGRFTPGQAWVDLLLQASYKEHKVPLGGKVVLEERGDLLTSQVKLAKRWKWDRETVRRYLASLESSSMIRIRTSKDTETGYTLIAISNYERYQGDGQQSVFEDPASNAPSDAPSNPASMPHPCPTPKKGRREEEELAGDGAPAGADVRRKPAKGNGRATDPNVKLVIDAYHVGYLNAHGTPPPINGGKAGAIAKKLLSGRKPGEAVWMVEEFFRNPPQYYADRNLWGIEHILAAATTLLARSTRPRE